MITKKQIQYLRAIAILCVLIHHALTYISVDGLWKILMIISVTSNTTIFMFVSGYLFENKIKKYVRDGLKRFIINKSKRLMVPYFICSGLISICPHILLIIPYGNKLIEMGGVEIKTASEMFFDIILFRNQKPEHLWYLYALFIIFFYSSLTWKRPYTNRRFFLEISLCVIISLWIDRFEGFDILKHIFNAYPYFIMGRNYDRLQGKRIKNSHIINICIYISVLITIFWFFGVSDAKGVILDHNAQVIQSLIHSVLWYCATYYMILFWIDITCYLNSNLRITKILKMIGDKSFYIYLFHNPYFLASTAILLSKITNIRLVIVGVSIFVSITCTIVIEKIIEMGSNKMTQLAKKREIGRK